MANYRKKQKFAGRITTTQGTGGTTTSSGSSTMKNGRGTRITTTAKSNGDRYITTTRGSGNGYYSVTRKSLNAKGSKQLKHNADRPVNFPSSDDSSGGGGTLIILGLIFLFMWLAEWLSGR